MFALFFAVHFTLLPKTGPGDAFMSQEFQDELIGNHYAISPKCKYNFPFFFFFFSQKDLHSNRIRINNYHPQCQL